MQILAGKTEYMLSKVDIIYLVLMFCSFMFAPLFSFLFGFVLCF